MERCLTPAEAGSVLRARDRRTVRRRLDALGVPRIPAGRSYLVRADDLDRALRSAAAAGRPANARPEGVRLPAGVKLSDPGVAELLTGGPGYARARRAGGER